MAGVDAAITASGARVRYLPPYSPDLNPNEKLFSKLKARLRRAAARDREALWKEIGELLNTVSASECTNYFNSCGYVSTYIENALTMCVTTNRRCGPLARKAAFRKAEGTR